MSKKRDSSPDGASSVAATSRWMAAARARESERTDRLFCDPLAAVLAGPEGFEWLGLDLMNRGLFFSPLAWPMQTALARRGAPGRFGTNTPETLLAAHGFDADVTQPGEDEANFGRWPRAMPGLPRSFLVRARHS
jgi:O-methyltransferase involved in polyketide biosynthesis